MKTLNPICRRELLYHSRATSKFLQIIDSVGIVSITLVMILLLINLWMTVASQADQGVSVELMAWVQIASWLIHIGAAGRAVIAGVEITCRYRVLHWDELKLTNITATHFLAGTWWAAFYRVRGWMLALGLIQLALVGLLMSQYYVDIFNREITRCYFMVRHYGPLTSCEMTMGWAGPYQSWQQWSPVFAPLAVSLAIVLAALEMMTCIAIGILAGLIFRSQIFALLLALTLRLLPVVMFSLWPQDDPPSNLIPVPEVWAWRWSEYTWFNLADGGTTGLMRLSVAPGAFWYGWRPYEGIVLAILVGFALFFGIFSSAIFISWLMLRLHGFSKIK